MLLLVHFTDEKVQNLQNKDFLHIEENALFDQYAMPSVSVLTTLRARRRK